MRQRVMIALAMVSNPQLLIADEPTTALDVTVRSDFGSYEKYSREIWNSIILITHDLGVVADISDRIIVMYAGQLLEEGLVDEVFKEPRHPYTKKLFSSVPRLDMDRMEAYILFMGHHQIYIYRLRVAHFLIDVIRLWLFVRDICQRGNTIRILIIVVVG